MTDFVYCDIVLKDDHRNGVETRMKIYVVRHGVTEWNRLRKVQGIVDIPLAEDGIRLARLTGEALKDVAFDLCYSSPLTRAVQTAKLVLGEHAEEVPMILDRRIREIDFGVLEGSIYKDENGNVLTRQMEDFFDRPLQYERPEGGENIADILARTRAFWEELIHDPQLQDKTILIASHGCAVRALLQNLYEDPENFWHGCVPPNCSVNIVEVVNGEAHFLEEDKVYAE